MVTTVGAIIVLSFAVDVILHAFGSMTWTPDAGPLDLLRELPVTGARRIGLDAVRRSA